jgi:hypothetical protein
MKVRIPFVINPAGKWCAYGYPGAQTDPDWSMVEEVADNGDFENDYQRGWIEVDLPVPQSLITVEGTAISPQERTIGEA